MKLIHLFSLLLCFGLIGCDQDGLLFSPTAELEHSTAEALPKSSTMGNPTKVFRTENTILIDGLESDWEDVPKRKIKKELDLGIPINKKLDLSGYFKVLWDEDNLYIFAQILDEEINISGQQLFEKDGFEVYIDGDNSKNTAPADFPLAFPPLAYDENDDFFRFVIGENAALSAWGIIDPSNFEFMIAMTPKGYNVEIKMPFTELPSLSPVPGYEFGFDVQINDNDGGERQNFLKWESGLDNSFFDPSLFGTLVLFDGTAG